MARGLGTFQKNERERTDRCVSNFIKNNPGTFSRNISKSLKMGSGTITNSIKRLSDSKEIIPLKDSLHFVDVRNSLDLKNKTRLVYNYSQKEFEANQKIEFCKNETNLILQKMADKQKDDEKKYAPILKKLSENTLKCIEKNVSSVIHDIKKRLQIPDLQNVNCSMIGIYCYRIIQENCQKNNDFPYAVSFYLKMLDDKFTHLKFVDSGIKNDTQKFLDLENFWTKNPDLNNEEILYDREFASSYKEYRNNSPHDGIPENFTKQKN